MQKRLFIFVMEDLLGKKGSEFPNRKMVAYVKMQACGDA